MANPFDQFDGGSPSAGNPFDQFDAPAASVAAPTQEAPQQPRSLMGWLRDTARGEAPYFLSAGVRPVMKAAFGLPNLVADASTALLNYGERGYDLAMGNQPRPYHELPSAGFNRVLDANTTAPTSTLGKIGEGVNTMIVGSMLPNMAPPSSVPEGFVPPRQSLKPAAAASAQEAGYVMPPSMSNPTLGNRLIEGVGGKIKLNQESSVMNQQVTNSLAARALGLNPDAGITSNGLNELRQQAYQQGYAPLRNIGEIQSTPAFTSALQGVVNKYVGAGKIDPKFGNPEIESTIEALKKPSYDSASLVDLLSVLRDRSKDAFGSGNSSVGQAYKETSKAVESLIEEHLAASGDEASSGMLTAYRSARALIAKSHDVGDALNNASGDVSARYLGRVFDNAPNKLTGELLTIGKAAKSFPKAFQDNSENFPAISPLDMWGSVTGAAVAHSAAPLALPISRVGARQYMLSAAGQARAIPQTSAPVDSAALQSFFGIGLPSIWQGISP